MNNAEKKYLKKTNSYGQWILKSDPMDSGSCDPMDSGSCDPGIPGPVSLGFSFLY